MALNPPLIGDVPMGIAGEMFCCKRGGMQLDLEAPGMAKLSLKGQIYLTTVRISFVPDARTSAVQAVDLPLQGISEEDFKQPIFGSNYLTGTVAPVPGRGLGGPSKFRLYFTHGGCNTFLKFFFAIMEKYKMADEAARRAFLASQRAVQSFIVDLNAYVDAGDPTTVFIVQPAAAAAPAAAAPAVAAASPMAAYAPAAAYGGAAAVGGGMMAMPAAAPDRYAAMPAHASAMYAGHGGAPAYSPASAAAGSPSCTPTYAAASPIMPPPVSPSYVPPPAGAVAGSHGGGAVPVAAYAPMPTGGATYATGGGGGAAYGGAAPAGGYVMYAAPPAGAYAPVAGAPPGSAPPAPGTTSLLKTAVPRFF